MYSVLVILAVIVAILLVFIVSIQESKGGGLASNFSASNQIMGVRKTTDFLEKATCLPLSSVIFINPLSLWISFEVQPYIVTETANKHSIKIIFFIS